MLAILHATQNRFLFTATAPARLPRPDEAPYPGYCICICTPSSLAARRPLDFKVAAAILPGCRALFAAMPPACKYAIRAALESVNLSLPRRWMPTAALRSAVPLDTSRRHICMHVSAGFSL